MDFSIREFHDSDYPAIVDLWQKTGMDDTCRGDDLDVIHKTIDRGGSLLVMLETKKNELIGTSWITTDGRRSYIHHFGIAPQYQGKKLSYELLNESFRYVKNLGLQVKIEVHKDNVKALNLYGKYPFKYLGDYFVFIIRNLDTVDI